MSKKSMQLDAFAFANASGIAAAIWYTFCSVFYLFSPSITEVIFQSWLPAFRLAGLWSANLLGNFLIGIVTFTVAVWLTAYGLIALYERFRR